MPQPLASAVKRCAGGSFIASSIPGCGFDAPAMRASCSMKVASASGKKRRSEEHTSELQSLMRISYAVLRFKKKTQQHPERRRRPQAEERSCGRDSTTDPSIQRYPD